MTKPVYTLVLVQSNNHIPRVEKLLQHAGIEYKIIPTPRKISSNCGTCVRIQSRDEETALDALDDADIFFRLVSKVEDICQR